MTRRPLFETRGWKIGALALILLVLAAAVEILARATFSTTNLLLNDLTRETPASDLEQVLWSDWREADRPVPNYKITAEEPLEQTSRFEKTNQQWFRHEFELSKAQSVDRSLSIKLEDNSLTARYDLELDMDHTLAQSLKRGKGQTGAQEFVDELLGGIAIYHSYGDEKELAFLGPYFESTEADARAHVWLVARPLDVGDSERIYASLGRPTVTELPLRSDLIMVDYPEGAQASVNGEGEVIKRNEKQLIFERSESGYTLEVNLIRSDAATGAPGEPGQSLDARSQQPPSAVSVLRNLHINPPVIGFLIFALLESLPLLMFLHFTAGLNGSRPPAPLHNQRLIVGLFLVFHFSLYGLESMREIPYLLQQLLGDMATLMLDSPFPFLETSGVAQVVIALVLAGYLWPHFVQRSLGTNSIALAAERVQLLRVVLAALLGVAVIVTLSQLKELPLLIMLLAWCGGCALVILASTSALLNSALGKQHRGAHQLRVTIVLIVLPVIGLLLYNPAYLPNLSYRGEPLPFAWLLPAIILLAVAMPLFIYFAELVYRAFTDRSLLEERQRWPAWARIAFVAGVALLAYPSSWLIDGIQTSVAWRNIYNLAYALDDLIYLPFLGMLLLILRDEADPNKGTALSPLARNLGIVAALAFFYSPTIRFLYIPVAFLLGYVVLSRWLLKEDQSLEGIADKILAQRREIIQAMVSLNYSRRALRQLKRALVKKTEEADFDLKAYKKKVKALEQSLRATQAKQPLTIDEVSTQDLALAVGSSTSNWENGKRTALYGMCFALPWIVLYVRDLAVDPNLDQEYLMLHFLSLSLSFIAQWALYGFFFGYFFRSIRGRNGLHKGFYFFLALVVPRLAITIIFVPAGIGDWPEFGFFALQLFIHSMLLGLVAGDYESLRRSKLGWFQLVEIHNFSALASWASSTAIAIGAAITAMLASVGPDLIRKVFDLGRMAPPELVGGG